ncbi:MAG: GNAT family N-acetyltransferase [Cyanobacteria bacterium SZAS TMP-1]|nr:GNAT family N-acetyltransferase [Cyanobacteria bacterium SZAS TMP-1]
MTDDIKIRRARGSDAQCVLDMIVEHAAFEGGEKFDPRGKLEKLRSTLEEQTHYECLIVEVKGKIEGYCTFMSHFDSWHQNKFLFVDGLWLNEAVRGLSIGTSIFDKLHQRAAELDCDSIQVMTPSTNDSGIRFYKKLGASEANKAYFTLPTKTKQDWR